MKQLIIMRGIPGAGKSTIAKAIESLYRTDYPTKINMVTIASADKFFDDGKVPFDAKLLKFAHDYCLGVATRSMLMGCAKVIVDNTNTRAWEFAPYVTLASTLQYNLKIVRVMTPLEIAVKYCEHKVPEDKIREMEARFEDADREYLYKREDNHRFQNLISYLRVP